MDFYRTGVEFEGRSELVSERNEASHSKAGQKRFAQRESLRKRSDRLRAVAGVMLTLAATMPASYGQQEAGAGTGAPVHNVVQIPDKAASDLPVAPAPVTTQPYPLRTSSHDYSKPFGSWLRNPAGVYMGTNIPKASFNNSVRLTDLVKDGKIYLSLSDAIALAIENNYDIAIARYDLDIADTDILRTKSALRRWARPQGW